MALNKYNYIAKAAYEMVTKTSPIMEWKEDWFIYFKALFVNTAFTPTNFRAFNGDNRLQCK